LLCPSRGLVSAPANAVIKINVLLTLLAQLILPDVERFVKEVQYNAVPWKW
jgi:hypothetical protein